MQPLPITACTAVSAMGRGMAETLMTLQTRRHVLRPCDFGGITHGYIGAVAGIETHFLPSALRHFTCRNNQLADLALHTDDFAARVHAARQRYGADRVAVVLGTSTSGILSGEDAYAERDPNTGALPGQFAHRPTQDLFSLADYVRQALELRGPAMVISTACASSARSFADAHQLIAAGFCDAAVVGGADSLCRMTLRGFTALELVSAVPCRPCDADRSGVSIGEAAGFALLERDGDSDFYLLGHGASSDGYHMSSPHPDGEGAVQAMCAALDRANLEPSQIDYINLHGTGTRANDAMEDIAVTTVFGTETDCSSTKGWSGHTLGACGILEAVIARLCINHDLRPGCLNVTERDPAFRAAILTDNRNCRTERIMSNAFGFGGVNCALILGRTP